MEEKLITLIWQYVEKLPDPLKILFLGAALMVYPLYRLVRNEEAQKALLQRIMNKAQKLSKEKLYENELFANIHAYRNHISGLTFEDDPNKTEAFRILLDAKLSSDERIVRQFLENDFASFTDWQLIFKFKELINNLVRESDEAIEAAFKSHYGHGTGTMLFHFVMDSEDGFRSSRKTRVNMLFLITDVYISKSPLKKTAHEKVLEFVNALNIAIYLAVHNAQRSFELFNGQITKIIRDGNY